MSPFQAHYGIFTAETLALLETAFGEVRKDLQRSGRTFDQTSTRNVVAELLVDLVRRGESDPRTLRDLVLAELGACSEHFTQSTRLADRGLKGLS